MTSPLPGALKIIDEWLANPELWEPWLPSEVETLLTDLREAIVADTRESTSSTPADEVRQAIHELEREIPDAYSEGRGEPCIVLTERAARVALSVLEASAVSAPPTITDEMVERALNAWLRITPEQAGEAWSALWRSRKWADMQAALRAALGGEA